MKHCKLASAALALTLCVSLLTACGNATSTSDVSGSTSGAASGNASGSSSAPTEPAHEPGLFLDDKKVEADPIMTVNGEKVSFDLFRYYYLTARYNFDGGDATAWEGEDADDKKQQLLDYTEQGVLSSFAIEAFAKENGVTLTDAENKAIDDEFTALKEQLGSEEAYQAALSQQYYTDAVYRYLYTSSKLMEKMIKEVYADEIKADVLKNYVHTQHILIPFTDAKATEHADDLKKAEEVLAKVKAGDDFAALMKEYSQDPGQPAEGYYFTKGQMVQEFEDAAYALKDGETSEIVQTSYGYHILKRLPMEDSYIDQNLMSLMSEDFYVKLTQNFDDKVKSFTITHHDNYEKIAPDTVF